MARKRRPRGPQGNVGDVIDIYCTACKLNLDGTVTALGQGREVLQVTCKTCDSVQKYHRPVEDHEHRKKLLRKAFAIRDKRRQQGLSDEERATAHSSNDITARWRKATEGLGARTPIYKVSGEYEEGDAMIHPQHGLGIVVQVLHENALVVLFREAEVPLEMGKHVEFDMLD